MARVFVQTHMVHDYGLSGFDFEFRAELSILLKWVHRCGRGRGIQSEGLLHYIAHVGHVVAVLKTKLLKGSHFICRLVS